MAVSRVLDRVGQVLGGRYRLLAPIGTGASASVYLADDAVLRRRVAVKVLHAALADDEAFLRRFRAEARAAAALNHPHIVAVYDWGQDAEGGHGGRGGHGGDAGDGEVPDGIPYLVSEYLGGGSLRAMLDQGTVLSPSQALLVGLETARGLEYAHRRGFVHRDIKPANLLFDEDARLRIADFGLARALAEAAWTEPMGAVLGTARYASPEQARGESLDGKSDVYSLALIIIEAVTGRVPFSADTTIGTLMARVHQPLPVPDSLGALVEPLRWAGNPDPTSRPDASAFGAALMAAAANFDRPAPFVLAGTRAGRDDLAGRLDPTATTAIDPQTAPRVVPVGPPPRRDDGTDATAGTDAADDLERDALAGDPTGDDADDPGRRRALAAGAAGVAAVGAAGVAAASLGVEGGSRLLGVDPLDHVGMLDAATGVAEVPDLAGPDLPALPPMAVTERAGARAPVIVNPTDAPPAEPVVEPKKRLARLRGTLPFTAPAALAEHFGVGSFDGDGDSRIEPQPDDGAERDDRDGWDDRDELDRIDDPEHDDRYEKLAEHDAAAHDAAEHTEVDPARATITAAALGAATSPVGQARLPQETGVIAKTLDGDPRTQPVAMRAYPPPIEPTDQAPIQPPIQPTIQPTGPLEPAAHGGVPAPWQRTGPIPVVEVAGVNGRPQPTRRRDADITNVESGAPFLQAGARYPSPSGLLSYADSYGDPDAAWPLDGATRYDDEPGHARAEAAELHGRAARRHARDERKAYRPPRRRWPAVLAVCVLLVGAAGGFAYWYAEVRIPYEPAPALVGKNVAEIDPEVSSFFTIVQVATFDDSAPPGKILAQKPDVATELPRRSIITLAVSAGPPPVKVPVTVAGQSLEQATATLTGLGLGVGHLTHRFDENTTADTVLSIAPGTPVEVPKGTDVALVVSDGPEPRTIPDGLVGHPRDEVTAKLADLGLKTSVTESFSDSIAEGNVISIDPDVGAKAAKGSTVKVEVSKGPPLVEVPDVSGLSVDDATSKIEDAGLSVSDVSGSPKNKVDSTDPAAGTKVKPGSTVKLTTKRSEILGIPLP